MGHSYILALLIVKISKFLFLCHWCSQRIIPIQYYTMASVEELSSLVDPQSSSVVSLAHQLLWEFRQQTGLSTNNAHNGASIKLAADYHQKFINFDLLARKCQGKKTLEETLEAMSNVIAIRYGLVTIERVCQRIGLPLLSSTVISLHDKLQSSIASTSSIYEKRQYQDSPYLFASLVYAATQAFGIRVSLSTICSASYANQRIAARCTFQLTILLRDVLDRLANNKDLVKQLRQEYKKSTLKKRTVSSVAEEKTVKVPVKLAIVDQAYRKSFHEIHTEHELGYAFPQTRPPIINQFIVTSQSKMNM